SCHPVDGHLTSHPGQLFVMLTCPTLLGHAVAGGRGVPDRGHTLDFQVKPDVALGTVGERASSHLFVRRTHAEAVKIDAPLPEWLLAAELQISTGRLPLRNSAVIGPHAEHTLIFGKRDEHTVLPHLPPVGDSAEMQP